MTRGICEDNRNELKRSIREMVRPIIRESLRDIIQLELKRALEELRSNGGRKKR